MKWPRMQTTPLHFSRPSLEDLDQTVTKCTRPAYQRGQACWDGRTLNSTHTKGCRHACAYTEIKNGWGFIDLGSEEFWVFPQSWLNYYVFYAFLTQELLRQWLSTNCLYQSIIKPKKKKQKKNVSLCILMWSFFIHLMRKCPSSGVNMTSRLGVVQNKHAFSR